MAKVLGEMVEAEDRSARFRTIIAFVKGKEELVFEGEVKGKISSTPLGEDGFGYDPVFIPEGKDRTFAQMTLQEKSEQNHRVRALAKFVEYLKSEQSQ